MSGPKPMAISKVQYSPVQRTQTGELLLFTKTGSIIFNKLTPEVKQSPSSVNIAIQLEHFGVET